MLCGKACRQLMHPQLLIGNYQYLIKLMALLSVCITNLPSFLAFNRVLGDETLLYYTPVVSSGLVWSS